MDYGIWIDRVNSYFCCLFYVLVPSSNYQYIDIAHVKIMCALKYNSLFIFDSLYVCLRNHKCTTRIKDYCSQLVPALNIIYIFDMINQDKNPFFRPSSHVSQAKSYIFILSKL